MTHPPSIPNHTHGECIKSNTKSHVRLFSPYVCAGQILVEIYCRKGIGIFVASLFRLVHHGKDEPFVIFVCVSSPEGRWDSHLPPSEIENRRGLCTNTHLIYVMLLYILREMLL